jgi:N-carbamoyl-L-amino-acid hydrolase
MAWCEAKSMPSTLQTDAESSPSLGLRIMEMAETLARWSDSPENLTCAYLTRAHRQTATQLVAWMTEAGMTAEIDVIGNVVGRYASDNPKAKTLIVGSHYDTVRNGGKYDGRLGVLLPIAVVDDLRRRRQRLPFHLEIIGFADEEGVRFGSTYLGSSAIVGRFEPALLDRKDDDGISLRDAVKSAGGDPAAIARLARRAEDVLGYLEVHIEQGPVLLDSGLPVGVVTAIAGAVRLLIRVTGTAGHAGTVPMGARRDAAAAAAELILYIERRCGSVPGLVGTVGKLSVPDGAINVIPGLCDMTLDLRSGDDRVRDTALAEILAEIQAIAKRRDVKIDVTEALRSPAIACSRKMQQRLARAVEVADMPVTYLASGAGHDAVMFGSLTEIGMLFVRCGNGGISHSPLETMTVDDAEIAARVFRDTLIDFV